MTPFAASSSTSATTSSNGRLISAPRTAGTMQKAHELSQPIWIVTQALKLLSRRTGKALGNSAWSSMTASSKISVTGPLVRAPSINAPARCTLWVPSTTSTHGARLRTSSRSFWAMQPATTSWRSSPRSFQLFRWPRLPYVLVSAPSRIQQVLTTTTSASSSDAAGTRPSASSRPAMRSESCSFIWHP